jgi:hypothetical protein
MRIPAKSHDVVIDAGISCLAHAVLSIGGLGGKGTASQ